MANYLNNKDLLREIHKSKFTYCWINNKEKHYFYDAIIFDKDEITEELLETSLQIRADRNAVQAFDKEIFNFQNFWIMSVYRVWSINNIEVRLKN